MNKEKRKVKTLKPEKLCKEMIKLCIDSLNTVLDREDSINCAGISFDGFPIFMNFPNTTKEQRRKALEKVIEVDKKNRINERV